MSHDITPLLRSWLQEPDGLPEPRIADVMALVHGTPQQRGWLPPIAHLAHASLFSPLRLMATGIVLALFGGFLLLATLAPPPPAEVVPVHSVAPASATPFSAEEFLSGMRTQELEPGVLRVVDDGAGHRIGHQDGKVVRDLDHLYVGPDDAIWVLTSASGRDRTATDTETASIWRLGTRGSSGTADGFPSPVPPATGDPIRLATAADGTLWVAAGHLASFDGRTWTAHQRRDGWHATGVEIASDGSVSATWSDDVGRSRAGRFDGSKWVMLDGAAGEPASAGHVALDGATYALAAGRPVRNAGDGWSEVTIPGLTQTPFGALGLRTAADGTLWVHVPGGSDGDRLASFDGQGWRIHAAPVFERWTTGATWDVAPDGAVWAHTPEGLVSYDGETWTEHVSGVRDFVIGRDGIVLARGPDGVQRYDGERWTAYPGLTDVNDIGLTSDGTGWAISSTDHSLYVVRRKAPDDHQRRGGP